MRKVLFDEDLYEETLVVDEVEYSIGFEKGHNDIVWCIIKKDDIKIIENPLTTTVNFTGPIKLPFNIGIYANNAEDKITADKLIDDDIEVFIDD